MIPRTRHRRNQFLFLCLLTYLRCTSCRHWTDVLDPSTLVDDGMPRVSAPRNKELDYESTAKSSVNAMSHMLAKKIEIEMHGRSITLFEEGDPFRRTSSPSASPSAEPSSEPSGGPTSFPTGAPSELPTTSVPPTYSPTARPTRSPTQSPTFSVADVPSRPDEGYFNYDPASPYGPSRWKDISDVQRGDAGYFWHTFDLDDSGKVSNDCGSDKKQSPIDVCRSPRESCTETHEMRPKSGDYKMDSEFIHKQILSNKLRLVMEPRTGEEPDPPQIDFSSNGRGIMDMTNIDFKFPSEHTVCGTRFDGEMQYFTYHPARKRFVAVSFFLHASDDNPVNRHLQEVIDEFILLYKEDERKCKERQRQQASGTMSAASSFASAFASGGNRRLHGEAVAENATTSSFLDDGLYSDATWNSTVLDEFEQRNGSLRSTKRRRLALKWHPFHPDVQKTVHFWGYSGSFTDPPCTRDAVDWKIMDVPTPISKIQLDQLRSVLFTHVDERCRRTSVHNAEGSVARPIQARLPYYKCTRDDYVSDEERAVCGDDGCVNPFGSGLNRYYPPLVDVTGPPTRSPSK